ncbi:unnamed protein product, partial [Allacma fusca]
TGLSPAKYCAERPRTCIKREKIKYCSN